MLPTAMSPSGGATARGCRGGAKALWGTLPGALRSKRPVTVVAWGAAEKDKMRLRPSALITGRGTGAPPIGLI